MKLVIIGGGSTYTPELIAELIEHTQKLKLRQVVLYDIDSERLSVVGSFASRLVHSASDPFKLVLSTDLSEAVTDADFCVFQLRVGGQEARSRDIQLGTDLGWIGQETTGIGGFAKALRTIPVVLDICRVIRQRAKESCRIINFTNPSGIVTQAISDHTDFEVVGLCNVPVIMQNQSAKLLAKRLDELSFEYVGLNHLGWLTSVLDEGSERLPELIEALAEDPELFRAANHSSIDTSLVRYLGAIPSPYLQYFYYTDKMFEKISTAEKNRAQIVMELDERILEAFADPSLKTLPELMSGRGGELYSYAAVNLMKSIVTSRGDLQIVNVRNGSSVSYLDPEDIIEVPAVIDQRGATPLPVKRVPDRLQALISSVKVYERLTVKTAVEGRYEDGLWALYSNPLTGDLPACKRALELLIERSGLLLEGRLS